MKHLSPTLLLLAALALAGCHTTRHAADGPAPDASLRADRPDAVVSAVNARRQTAGGIRSKISLKLSAAGKSATVGGTLKMKRDEIIQLSLNALGLIEIGRMELTPDYVMVQDKVHKQYMQVRWADVPALSRAGIGFDAFQALFWNELFVPGKRQTPAGADFTARQSGNGICLTPAADSAPGGQAQVQFLIDTASSALSQTTVATGQAAGMSFRCRYGSFTQLEKKDFPAQLLLSIVQGVRSYDADISLSNPQADEKMADLATRIPSGYRQVQLDDILRQLTQAQ